MGVSALERYLYPQVIYDTDSAAIRAKRAHIRIVAVELVLMVGATLAVTVAAPTPALQKAAATLSVILVVTSMVAELSQMKQRNLDDWFSLRSIAESMKSMCWRYSMGVPPYVPMGSRLASEELLRSIRALMADAKQAIPLTGDLVTPEMDRLARLGPAQRAETYLKHRIMDQIDWYASMAKADDASEREWAWIILGIKVGVAILLILQIGYGGVNVARALLTIATAAIAWTQALDLGHLKKPYVTAEIELTEARMSADDVDTDDQLVDLVIRVEAAVSREHTTWHARRAR